MMSVYFHIFWDANHEGGAQVFCYVRNIPEVEKLPKSSLKLIFFIGILWSTNHKMKLCWGMGLLNVKLSEADTLL